MICLYLNIEHLGQPEELIPLIKPYFLIVLSGMIPLALFNTFAQWSYAINHTRMPMWIILGANALNILGNYLLIYGNWGCPELGLIGAGIATLTSRIVCAAVIIAIFQPQIPRIPHRFHVRTDQFIRHLHGQQRIVACSPPDVL